MGAWGTTLYANDSASDIRGDYVDGLKRGLTNEEITEKLIKANWDIMGDEEEEPLFWFALADTQWNYGRLLPNVKEKALSFLDIDRESERWKESGEKKIQAWRKTLNALEVKLNSPMPAEKKVSKYRFHQCPWNLGDVFAYQFSSDYSKEKGFFGQYVAFRKVSEDTDWPGNIAPVVQVYKWIGEKIPALVDLEKVPLLVQNCYPITLQLKPNTEKKYVIKLIRNSRIKIPERNLTYLGNVPGDDLIPFRGHDLYLGIPGIGWDGMKVNHTFEKYIIDTYLAWRDYD